jgi:hypothetical protein
LTRFLASANLLAIAALVGNAQQMLHLLEQRKRLKRHDLSKGESMKLAFLLTALAGAGLSGPAG